MTITVQDIRNFVWNYLDLSIEDVPTSLIDAWIADGDRRIARRTKKLPYFEATTTFNTVAGTAAYTVPNVTVGSLSVALKDITQLEGPHGPLPMMDASEAEAQFFTLSPTNSWPRAFTVWGGKITLYPTPDAIYTYTVRGYRARTDWMAGGAGAAPDLPVDFHGLVQEWTMYRAHEQQDDAERAQEAKQAFSEGLAELIADETSSPPATPIVVNSGRPIPTMGDRLRFPWE